MVRACSIVVAVALQRPWGYVIGRFARLIDRRQRACGDTVAGTGRQLRCAIQANAALACNIQAVELLSMVADLLEVRLVSEDVVVCIIAIAAQWWEPDPVSKRRVVDRRVVVSYGRIEGREQRARFVLLQPYACACARQPTMSIQ